VRARRLLFLLPLFGGVLIALSLPPFGFWPLAFPGVGLLARSIEGRGPRSRLASGLLAGIGQFGIGLFWAVQFSAAGYVVLVIFESLFVAVACLATPRSRGRVPALAGLLTLAEWARQSWPFGGLPLGGIALGAVNGPLSPAARLGGPLLLVLATCLAGIALGELFSASPRRILFGCGLILVVVAIGLGGALAPRGGAPVGHIRVAAVQGGGKRGLDQLQVPPSVVYDAALRPTLRLRPPLNLVLWPEDVVGLSQSLADSPVKDQLASVARELHTTLIVGVTEPVGATRFRNEMVAFGPSGAIVSTYEKVHRVPFGEYVPDRSFFAHFASLKDVPRDAIPGHGSGMMVTPAGKLAVTISFEVFFTDRGLSAVRAGGEVMLVPTNTSSYKLSEAPTEEVAASELQAISEGRNLVQVAPTGFSAVINEDGRVLVRSALSVEDVIEATVPLRSGHTIFTTIGQRPVLGLCLLLSLAGLAAALEQAARTKRAPVAAPQSP